MSDERTEELTAQVMSLATELREAKASGAAADRITSLETAVKAKDAEIEAFRVDRNIDDLLDKVGKMDEALKAFNPSAAQAAKAAAIMAGADAGGPSVKAFGEYNTETNWLKALVERKNGDSDAQQFVKAVLGTSDATGQAIIPNNFVAKLVEQVSAKNIYRSLMDVVSGVRASAVDIPYEITGITSALLQGAYGSNKDIRDFQFGQATATLYTIAQIADVGNQLLRQSNGAAEQVARRRLGLSIARLEAEYITNGSGSSQPLGFFPAFLAFGDIAAFKTTLSSEPRAATLGRAYGALEARSRGTDGLATVMSPVDFWEMATEGLGTAYAGGWAMDPTGGPGGSPVQRAWGVPIYRDPFWPTAQVGTALAGYWGDATIFLGDEYRIDVSSEAGSRFDNNTTGFRAEEEFGFNAEPYVRTGAFQKIIGL